MDPRAVKTGCGSVCQERGSSKLETGVAVFKGHLWTETEGGERVSVHMPEESGFQGQGQWRQSPAEALGAQCGAVLPTGPPGSV